jgi:hypothetical protein
VEFGVPDFQTSPYVKWIYYIYVQHTNIHVIYTYIYICICIESYGWYRYWLWGWHCNSLTEICGCRRKIRHSCDSDDPSLPFVHLKTPKNLSSMNSRIGFC